MALPFIHISKITRQRWQSFRAMKRAWWSLWILTALYVFSLLAPWLVNDKPLVMNYGGKTYFPAFKFYPDKEFGGLYGTEADYLRLRELPRFTENAGWMLMPPVPHSPYRSYLDEPGNPPHPPSSKHWLGTDESARDVFSRLIHGFRISMTFSLAVTLFSTTLGLLIGGVQGYFGKSVDLLGQRVIEIWGALPSLYIIILLGAIYGRSMWMLILVTTAFGWISLSYYTRGEFLKLKNQAFVTASQALGAGHSRIIGRQMLPNALSPAITLLPFGIIAGISAITALDFLGFGLPPPTPSWGELMQQGLARLFAPWLAASAVAALFITLQLTSFVGEGVRAAFDPKAAVKLR